MFKQRQIRNTFLIGMMPVLFSLNAEAVTYSYLEDAEVTAPKTTPGAPSIDKHLFPRTMLGDPYVTADNRYSKYHILATQASRIKEVGIIQKNYPDLMYFRMFTPRETQEYENSVYCSQGKNIPFEGNAAATGNCKIYPGHWLYRAGIKTTKFLSTTGTVINVSDSSKYTVGRYVVIYDAPAASFKNAEHALITGKNTSTGTITVKRGYKSTPVSHSSGAIVAQHVIGQGGGDARNWAYNLSTQCPKDANGRQINAYLALFLKNNLKKDWRGDAVNVNVSGIMFDVDYNFELTSKLSDVNNDLVTDHGISGSGVNWYGQGTDVFYAKVRSYFPDFYIVGGTPRSRGEGVISGTQFEGWVSGFEGKPAQFDSIDEQLSNYTYHMHNQAGPVHSNALMKQGTKIHPVDGVSNPNSLFRLGLGLTLLDDGYYGQVTKKSVPDTWYDEFSVDVEAKSPTYGQAVASNPFDESATRKHRGWLGKPLGPRKRIYTNAFAPSKSLISNSSFDANLTGWTANKVNISRVTSSTMDGSGALRASKHTIYQSNLSSASITGPSPSLITGKEYTLTFSAKAPAMREIKAKVGTAGQSFIVGPKWRRYVMTFKSTQSGAQKVKFLVGRENSEVFLDTVHLFEGNANVFRRDFDNGIVIVNATNSSRTVSLGSKFQRIQGNQDPSINNGVSSSSVTLPKMDAILLVRPDGTSGTPAPAPSANECGAPTYNAGTTEAIYLWKDCAGDGSWHFRITGGGSSTAVTYDGSVSSVQAFTNVAGFGLESSDTLDSSDPYKIVYKLLAMNAGQDGVDFSFPQGSSACFNATTHANVKLGSGAVTTSLPLDLDTLGSCSVIDSGLSLGDECGAPSVDTATEKGAYLWKECGTTGEWKLVVSAGGSATAIKYLGTVSSADPISVTNYSIESSDDINISNTRNIKYKMNVIKNGIDGIIFTTSNAGGCVDLTEPAGVSLYLGVSKIPVSIPLDLLTLNACK